MKHYKFDYARVSTEQQNLDRQLDMLKAYGVDHTYNEKMTGTKKDRPELAKLLDRMEAGDTVVIESLSRLGWSAKGCLKKSKIGLKDESFDPAGADITTYYDETPLSDYAVKTQEEAEEIMSNYLQNMFFSPPTPSCQNRKIALPTSGCSRHRERGSRK